MTEVTKAGEAMPATRAARHPPSASQRAPVAKGPKTAVIVIHGMGEQWPMDTLADLIPQKLNRLELKFARKSL